METCHVNVRKKVLYFPFPDIGIYTELLLALLPTEEKWSESINTHNTTSRIFKSVVISYKPGCLSIIRVMFTLEAQLSRSSLISYKFVSFKNGGPSHLMSL